MFRPLAAALAFCAGVLLHAAPAAAEDMPAPPPEGDANAALCERAILNAARRGGVPPEILYAIALTETGRKTGDRVRPYPWAINREGKGHWFTTREEALAFAEDSLRQGRKSFDVGCVQINYRWHGQAFPSLNDMFDPEWTATYAAQFLRTLYEERGDWSAAAGAYHSLTPELANIYRARFDKIVAGLDPAMIGADDALLTEAAPADRRSTRAARRQADRAAAAARIRDAGPPPEPVMGSLAGMRIEPTGPGLLTQGTPMLSQGQPLLTAAGGSLF